MSRGRIVLGLMALSITTVGIGCNGNENAEPAAVCTTGMVADVVENVAGGRIRVVTLMGAGVDPHLYRPTAADARELKNARIIFSSGLHLEGNMTEMLESLAQSKPSFVLTDSVPKDKILKDEHGTPDPHVWFDVELWSHTADGVCEALVKLEPAYAEEFRDNAKKYKDRLMKLHQKAKEQIGSIPMERRVLVTAHDAFRYFGRAYHIEVRGLQGISTTEGAGISERNDLVNFIVERKIKAIFVESTISPKSLEALKEDCLKKGHSISIGGELFSDAMGQRNTREGTYEGMVEHNVETIVKALR